MQSEILTIGIGFIACYAILLFKPKNKKPMSAKPTKNSSSKETETPETNPENSPVTESPAKYTKTQRSENQLEFTEGQGVFYNAGPNEQEMFNIAAKAQGFIEHGLANGNYQLKLTNLQGNPVSVQAKHSETEQPGTFQLS